MRLFVITLAALLGMATHMKAQSFTQHIQQHTKDTGTVTVVQSKDIDELVNSADVSGHKQVNPAKTANPSQQPFKPCCRQQRAQAWQRCCCQQQERGTLRKGEQQ